MTVTYGDLSQSVALKLDRECRPLFVVMDRWSNANADKEWHLQPFGATRSLERTFGGYRIPAHVEAGNLYGTDGYFPFFVADLCGVTFR